MKDSVAKMDSHNYALKQFRIGENGLEENEEIFQLSLVRGSKIEGENKVDKQDGFLTEQLLWVCQEYLASVNKGKLVDENTNKAIAHIQTALAYLNERTKDRIKRKVLNTYGE